MVRRSSTTSRGTTYWFPYFCFAMSRLSGLRMRNFSDLMCLPKSREEKVGNKAMKESFAVSYYQHCSLSSSLQRIQCMQIWCRFAPRSIESSYFREQKKKKGMGVWNSMLILLPCASDGVEEGK